MLKRGFDFCVAFIVLMMAVPVMALIAILLAASIGRPVLFRQQRPGLRAQPFMLYKFRTMSERRDAQGELLGDELRLTTVGSMLRRLSLDELPQLFNVLKGDMSLVGPRPLLMEYLPLYSTEQARRHDVRPGITGWAQVNGRNAVAWEARFALDVWYVEHQSFSLDLRILWLTVLRVLRSDGINQPGAATMQKFTGGQHERR
jgi:sugar transferase EpsL